MNVRRIHPEIEPRIRATGRPGPSVDTLRSAVRETTAIIQPFRFENEETGEVVSVTVSPFYTTITIDDRAYHCVRETGEFDGISAIRHKGPVLISEKE